MAGIVNTELILWSLSLLLQITVACLVLGRRRLAVYPGLCAYLVVNVTQSGVLIVVYRLWGYQDFRAEQAAWISQIPVLLMRAWAISDICRLLLGRYQGIWGLAWRMLVALATGLGAWSIASAGRQWSVAVLKANISLELSTVLLLVALFLFARYYRVTAAPAVRALALGFLIYSSCATLNDTVLQHWLVAYVTQWQILGTLSFLVSVSFWLWAVLQPVTEPAGSFLPRDVYYAVAPEVNLRLRLLNERLSRFWSPEGDRP